MKEKEYLLIEVIDSFRMRYVIDNNNLDESVKAVLEYRDFDEMSQKFLGSELKSVRGITEEEYLKIFDEDNDYLSNWPKEQKLSLIRKLSET